MKNRIKVLRAERGFTQEKLARICGTSRGTINAIENELVCPNGYTMLCLVKAFNVPVEEIFLDFLLFENNRSNINTLAY